MGIRSTAKKTVIGLILCPIILVLASATIAYFDSRPPRHNPYNDPDDTGGWGGLDDDED